MLQGISIHEVLSLWYQRARQSDKAPAHACFLSTDVCSHRWWLCCRAKHVARNSLGILECRACMHAHPNFSLAQSIIVDVCPRMYTRSANHDYPPIKVTFQTEQGQGQLAQGTAAAYPNLAFNVHFFLHINSVAKPLITHVEI